ncbi:hypothetical protein C8J57DRAFT_1465141 [Mycena rebaudengoi]|nr:hypothetical protein C8J57DRAFT_1465141 [Mycena rebaudengoi]
MASPGPVPDSVEGAAAAAAIAAAVQQIKEVFATSFIGFAVATAVYGISVLQCYLYYRNYRKDAVLLKVTVGCLWLFDTLSTIMVTHSLYTYFVTNFGDLAADALIPWSFALENGLLTMVTITAQWQFLCLANLDSSHGSPTISGSMQSTAAACDIAIPLALIWCLRSKKSHGVRSTEQMIDAVILYAVCRGILTAMLAGPDRTYWQPFHQVVGKLYVNSVVASLNVRNVIRGQPEVSESIRFEPSHRTGEVGSTTRNMPLVFKRPKTESTGSLNQYAYPANDTKVEIIPNII